MGELCEVGKGDGWRWECAWVGDAVSKAMIRDTESPFNGFSNCGS